MNKYPLLVGLILLVSQPVIAGPPSRIIRAASRYLQQHPRWANEVCRFDVVSLSGDEGDPEIEWIRDAFEL